MPAPYTNSAAKSSGTPPVTAATTTPTAPAPPARNPRPRPGRRPRSWVTRPISSAADADPRVKRAVGRPDRSSEPEHLAGEQRTDRDPGGESRAAEDLCGRDDGQNALLQGTPGHFVAGATRGCRAVRSHLSPSLVSGSPC